MPRHERLAEPDVPDQLADGRGRRGEPAEDPEAVHVGERLVDEPQLSEILRLVDHGRERAADVGGGWGQRAVPRAVPVASTTVYINGG
jgi:hypothetical protein